MYPLLLCISAFKLLQLQLQEVVVHVLSLSCGKGLFQLPHFVSACGAWSHGEPGVPLFVVMMFSHQSHAAGEAVVNFSYENMDRITHRRAWMSADACSCACCCRNSGAAAKP